MSARKRERHATRPSTCMTRIAHFVLNRDHGRRLIWTKKSDLGSWAMNSVFCAMRFSICSRSCSVQNLVRKFAHHRTVYEYGYITRYYCPLQVTFQLVHQSNSQNSRHLQLLIPTHYQDLPTQTIQYVSNNRNYVGMRHMLQDDSGKKSPRRMFVSQSRREVSAPRRRQLCWTTFT